MNDIERGCESVYEDLGHPDAEEMMVKAQLAAKISEFIAERQWSQQQAATIIGLTQPKLSQIALRGGPKHTEGAR